VDPRPDPMRLGADWPEVATADCILGHASASALSETATTAAQCNARASMGALVIGLATLLRGAEASPPGDDSMPAVGGE